MKFDLAELASPGKFPAAGTADKDDGMEHHV
jgi:hypothetical protein